MRLLYLPLLILFLSSCQHYEPTIRQDDGNPPKRPGLFTGETGEWKILLMTKKIETEKKN